MNSFSENPFITWQEAGKKLAVSYSWIHVLSNVTGIIVCFSYFAFFDEIHPRFSDVANRLPPAAAISLGLIALGTFLSNKWMKPIRNFIQIKIDNKSVPGELEASAKKRILNLPIASALVSMLNWCIASIAIPFCYKPDGLSSSYDIKIFFWIAIGIFISGLVTSAIVFFQIELICRPIWEKFFPEGEFVRSKGIFRINLWHRILLIFFMASLFPLADMAVISYEKAQMMATTAHPETLLKSLLLLILFLLTIEFCLVFILSVFMSRSIVAPILNLKAAMQKVGKGDFDARARVVDNNELGILSLHFNRMTKGLKERYDLVRSLAVAKEVQQNLLPHAMPKIAGLDIAGRSLYCDQTGGDYFDFIDVPENKNSNKLIAVGDVSGHGIPSALLMTSARAFLRQRAALGGPLNKISDDVNLQFCKDVGDSGRFMTLFLMAYDNANERCDWVRAGHDPALHYNPETDTFTELKGRGIPLGIDSEFSYEKNTLERFGHGQIIFIGTDGIWESSNDLGNRFGKDNVKEIIRSHKNKNANHIMTALLDALDQFIEEESPADDITLVVIKRM